MRCCSRARVAHRFRWTRTIEAAEYAGFLTTLFHQVAGGQPPDLYFWRPADEVVYGGYVLEDDDDGGGEEEGGQEEEEEEEEQEEAMNVVFHLWFSIDVSRQSKRNKSKRNRRGTSTRLIFPESVSEGFSLSGLTTGKKLHHRPGCVPAHRLATRE